MKQKQNIAYTFLIFFCLLAYTHYDYVVAENMKIGGPLFVAMFLTVLNFSTHTPFYDHFPLRLRTFHGKGVPQDKIGFYERANFFDHHLDRFLKALKKKGLWENTLVVLASDHHLEEWMENNKRGKIPFIITGGYHSPL